MLGAVNKDTITRGLRYSIATGNWGMQGAAGVRPGVSQVSLHIESHPACEAPVCRGTILQSLRQSRRPSVLMSMQAKLRRLQTCFWSSLKVQFQITAGACSGID